MPSAWHAVLAQKELTRLPSRWIYELSGVVRDWFFDEGRGKGTKSGLP